ncbi:MAG TPA: DsbA family oxidoreductase [Bacteroidales bacterium]|nr:DsbA family oxidoreductase [Bacteroidales bacterium]
MENVKVEIWSDIRCPFCYLGKKRFEAALEQFPHRGNVRVMWRSFQLDPYLITQPETSVYDHLADQKGITREQSIGAHEQIVLQGRNLGIEYNFDKAIVANSFNAHRLVHLAKQFGLDGAAEERLFKAYFSEGENISDMDTLVKLGTQIGISKALVRSVLERDDYTDNVLMDETYARELGITGVPFFLFNEALSVRGAQPPDTFLRALFKAWETMASPSDKVRSYVFKKL